MKKSLLFLSLFIGAFFYSCKNDLDVLDKYKETMVVYGLLNPADTVQYIKINKAFLGAGDAYTMASNPDSINYTHGEINAHLEQWHFGNYVQSIQLYRDSVIPKDSGSFAYPYQILYRTSAPILQDGSDYLLIVINENSGLSVKSDAKIVQPIQVSVPIPSQTINLVGQTPFKTKWNTAANGRLYSVTVRFHYKERYILDTLQVANKYIDLNFVSQRASNLEGGQQLEEIVTGDNFFRTIGHSPLMDHNPNKERFFQSVEFIYYAAAEEFATYMDVANTTSVTFGVQPTYSNIDGGVGLFSSRYDYSVPNILLSQATLDSLRNGQYTSDLNFH